MKRCVVRVMVCLVLGVMTTVGVAWGAAWQDVLLQKVTRWTWFEARLCVIRSGGVVSERKWFANLPEEAKAVLIAETEHDSYWYSRWPNGAPPDATMLRTYEPLRPRTNISGRSPLNPRIELEFGWPLRALWCWKDQRRSAGAHGTIGSDVFQRFHVRYPGYVWEGLPVLPLWGGLIADVSLYGVFYGVVLYGSFAAVRTFRERWRRRRGICCNCGYDLVHKFDDGCPECGWNRA